MLRTVIVSLFLAVALGQAQPLPAASPSAAPGEPMPTAVGSTPAAGSAAPIEVAAGPLQRLLDQVDAAWRLRDQPDGLRAGEAALDEAARLEPGAYAVLWRQARLLVWQAEDPAITDEVKSRLGKRAWDLAEQAAALNPGGVEGWFYAAAGMGNYSLGIGILSALTQGIEGKFKDRLGRAEKVDAGFLAGGVPVAWGRFWFKLPWPKHDARRSRAALAAALAQNADNVRAHVYLGDLEADEGHKQEARAAWQAALDAVPERYDGPEGRRWQAEARGSLARLEKR